MIEEFESAVNNRHFSYQELRRFGMKINLLEDDNELQDKVLTIFHAYMITFQRFPIAKIIENSESKSWVVQRAAQ